ncbi:hypothetical protein PCASD_04949 [Puccinia coronata f. sp. avenae]|uniref:Uncharacterized protein n=1 Tax=Puccinia coronata f. sp. avenae TaxID=200324 RepID=A0A2N5VDB1_9BASI|nr:hypothetical protein PCASD_25010 [Puccinia coronata f. sp. avenae]PLW47916.1 hypothetical protein PCASD_04949 [Puccinia coronata f. sp. avenae]
MVCVSPTREVGFLRRGHFASLGTPAIGHLFTNLIGVCVKLATCWGPSLAAQVLTLRVGCQLCLMVDELCIGDRLGPNFKASTPSAPH